MVENTLAIYQNPKGFEIDFNLLQEFENGLDPNHPERNSVPCRVLGFGEISTVFEIQAERMSGLAFKRMGIFETKEEVDKYLVTYQLYNRLLEGEIGLNLPAHGHAAFINQSGQPIFYIIQQKIPAPAIGNKAMHLLPTQDALALFRCLLRELLKVWKFNQRQAEFEVGLDGQVSNWIIEDFNIGQPSLTSDAELAYVDTSTPFLRTNGVEQLDPELFLRSAPSFLAWILRILYLDEVMDRYYDFRKVVIDLLANCCKEQMPELIPELIEMANKFFAAQARTLDIEPIQEKEVLAYYREDALIWVLYLWMRRFDRFLHRFILFRPYPHILPGKTKR